MIGAILPACILVVNTIYWGFRKLIQWLFFTTIIIHVFFQATVIKELTNVLVCSDIDKKKYISSALDVSCDDATYKKWVSDYKISILINSFFFSH